MHEVVFERDYRNMIPTHNMPDNSVVPADSGYIDHTRLDSAIVTITNSYNTILLHLIDGGINELKATLRSHIDALESLFKSL